MAKENTLFTGDFPIETPISSGFPSWKWEVYSPKGTVSGKQKNGHQQDPVVISSPMLVDVHRFSNRDPPQNQKLIGPTWANPDIKHAELF